jgi:phage protein D
VQSDTVEITLTDHLPYAKLEIPPNGAEIEVSLGYTFERKYMGLFIADSIELGGPPDLMRISGVASVNGTTSSGKTALTDQKNRSWPEGTTVSTLVSTIAGEHGLKPAISESLASIALPHLDQTDESDINLLTRVALDLDAIAKPGGGYLGMFMRGESKTASGQDMPTLSITKSQDSRWTYRQSLREPAGKVIAVWRDQDAAADIEVTAGDSEPIRRLNKRYASLDAAQRAADAEYKRSQRAGATVSLSLPGDPDLVAEARLVLAGFRQGVDGEWLVTRVTHTIDSGGYRCDVEAESL